MSALSQTSDAAAGHPRKISWALLAAVMLSACTTVSDPVLDGLPVERTMPARTQLTLYLPAVGDFDEPVRLNGNGTWTLLFEPGPRPGTATVSLRNADFAFEPFAVAHDIDNDGRVDVERIEGLRLGVEDFDLERTRGLLNLGTNEFEMTVAHRLSSARFPVLEALGIGALEFSYVERGTLDLERGVFLTHAERVALPGPLAELAVGNCETSSSCRPKVLSFAAVPRYVCSVQCNAKATSTLFAMVKYEDNGKACNPANSDPGFTAAKKLQIRNDSKNLAVPAPGWSASSGSDHFSTKKTLCAGSSTTCDPSLSVATEAWFALSTFDSCGDLVESDRAKLGQLPAGHSFTLCTKDVDEYAGGSWAFPGNNQLTGNGGAIVISAIRHLASPTAQPPFFGVYVKTTGTPAPPVLAPGGTLTDPYSGRPADKPWTIEVPGVGSAERADYEARKNASLSTDFCVQVDVKCDCKPQ